MIFTREINDPLTSLVKKVDAANQEQGKKMGSFVVLLSDDEGVEKKLKGLAETANEIGMRTKKYGVRLSLHPHLWGPMEREHDFRRVMELTDPNYVYLILDTGHNVLGGMDVVKMTEEFFPRITEFHLKDTFPQYRGNKAGPTPEDHKQKSVYASVGHMIRP